MTSKHIITSQKVNKEDFIIESTIGNDPYYAIVHKDDTYWEWSVVFGGDSACEDHYDLESVQAVYNDWDGVVWIQYQSEDNQPLEDGSIMIYFENNFI